jgi:hypothetical protein
VPSSLAREVRRAAVTELILPLLLILSIGATESALVTSSVSS